MTLRLHQHLIFDADDTLWENNRYFEAAFRDFVAFLNHEHLTHNEIREVLDTFQLEHRHTNGYGSRSFATSLRHTFQQVMNVEDDNPMLDQAQHFGLRILEQEMEPITGVDATLKVLKSHHDLVLLTKGDPDEQRAKITRSGIEHHFDSTIIVTEKTTETYRELIATTRFDPLQTWMIGNSPRSDINPALQAGLNAIFIPHELTWHLEVEDIASIPEHHSGQLVQLESFDQLLQLFVHDASDV